jgi:hypothetical protein
MNDRFLASFFIVPMLFGCSTTVSMTTGDTGATNDTDLARDVEQQRDVLVADAGQGVDSNVLVDVRNPDASLGDTGPLTDAGVCSNVIWVDSEPTQRSVSMTVPLRLLSTGSTFEFFYQHTDFTPCDSPCPVVVEVPSMGTARELRPAYWAPTNPDALSVGVVEGSPIFMTRRGTEITWIRGAPSTGSRWLTGTTRDVATRLPAAATLADVATDATSLRLYFASHRMTGRMGEFDNFVLHEMNLDGTYVGTRTGADPFLTFPHRDLSLNSGADFVVAGIQNWDFPPTVQFTGLRTRFSTDGSSCGMDAYALTSSGATEVAAVHGCRANAANSELRILLRRAGAADTEAVLATDRFSEADSAVAIANRQEGGWVAAYWNTAGGLSIVLVERNLTVSHRAVVPGPAFFWAETFPGPIALAQTLDGTYAVAWSAGGGGAIQRFRLSCM